MGQITVELLRRRAEHNDGILFNLQETALHGQNIQTIEVVGEVCRQLKILYLQNNVISVIENLHHLKELEYLNLAVNNITKVENLHRCESLRKLDLTMNFIPASNLPSLANLKGLYNLREIHLLGNPCTQFEGYRQYVVAALPQLERLDGEDIAVEERIAACQQKDATDCNLQMYLADNKPSADKCDSLSENGEDGEIRRPWCLETRLMDHREQERRNTEAERQRTESQNRLLNGPTKKLHFRHDFPPLPEKNQAVTQKNEGKWDFSLMDSEDDAAFVLDVALGKGTLTSDARIDVQCTAVRLLVKGKLLQLALEEQVDPKRSSARRSKTTGNLVVHLPKADPRRRPMQIRGGSCGAGSSGATPSADNGKAGNQLLSCKILVDWEGSEELPPV